MKKTEAIEAMNSGREVLRLRSRRSGWAQPVRITGVGYSRRDRWTPAVATGNGVRVAYLDQNGKPTGNEDVFPLGQLHLKTLAEWREEQRLANEAQIARIRAQRAEEDALLARADAAVEALGIGTVATSGYSNRPYVHLTVKQAEELVAARKEPQ